MKTILKSFLINGLVLVLALLVFGIPLPVLQGEIWLGLVAAIGLFALIGIIVAVITSFTGAIGFTALFSVSGANKTDAVTTGSCLGWIFAIAIDFVFTIWLAANLYHYFEWFPRFTFWEATALSVALLAVGLVATDWEKVNARFAKSSKG